MSETTQTVEDKLAALQEALERKRAIVGEAHAVKAPAKGPTVPDDEGEASPDRPGSENAASERSASVAEPNQPGT